MLFSLIINPDVSIVAACQSDQNVPPPQRGGLKGKRSSEEDNPRGGLKGRRSSEENEPSLPLTKRKSSLEN